MGVEKASFAAGCFWGVEARFRKIPGVIEAAAGYMGGHIANPSYEDVCTGNTGHAETVQLSFDPEVVSYSSLLDAFFEMHNPTTLNRQGPDRGTQYRSAVFYHTPEQQKTALGKINELGTSGRFRDEIVTEVAPAGDFWRAEEYHQQYLEKNKGAHCSV